jgi:hypothetical protein
MSKYRHSTYFGVVIRLIKGSADLKSPIKTAQILGTLDKHYQNRQKTAAKKRVLIKGAVNPGIRPSRTPTPTGLKCRMAADWIKNPYFSAKSPYFSAKIMDFSAEKYFPPKTWVFRGDLSSRIFCCETVLGDDFLVNPKWATFRW